MTRERWKEGGEDVEAWADALGKWRKSVERIEAAVRIELGLGPAEVVRPREVVNEVMRLADPHAVRGRDVVIPGGRHDLVRRWIEARLSGRAMTAEARLALARELAPDPGKNYVLTFSDWRRRNWRWSIKSRFTAQVSADAAERFKDAPPFEG